MLKLLILFIIIAPFRSNAFDLKNMLRSPTEDECEIMSEEDLLQMCAQEICGPPSKVISGQLTDHNFKDYVKPEAMKRYSEIEEDVNTIIKNEKEFNDELIENLKSSVKDGKLDYNFSQLQDYSALAENLFKQYYRLEIDHNQPINKRVKVKLTPPENASKEFKQGLTDYAQEKLKNSYSDTYLMLRNGFFKDNKEAFYFLKKDYSKTKKKSKELTKFFQSPNQKYWVLVDVAGKMIDDNDNQRTPYCKSKICQKAIQEYYKSIDVAEGIKKLEKIKNDPELSMAQHRICKAELALNNLADFDEKEIKKNKPEIVALILKNATKGFSAHSKKALEDYLNNGVQLKTNSEKGKVEDFISKIKKKTENAPYHVAENIFEYVDALKQRLSSPLPDVCRKGPYSVISDNFRENLDPNKKDTIGVSQLSCTHLEHGKEILAHELGHAITQAFRRNLLSEESFESYKELRSCLSSNQKDPYLPTTISQLRLEDDTYRTEEDTADYISTLVFKDSNIIYQCGLLKISDDEKTYTDLSLNERTIDTHSPTIYRVLMEALRKNKELPESCKSAMKKSKLYGFNLCMP